MTVNEIFYSIDGEGLRTGELTIFIRLAGCNLNCSYCDTKYALKANAGKEMSIDSILQEIKKFNCKNITLTGGEPLIHKDIDKLINNLIKNEYKVNIETNGSIDIGNYVDKCLITMDYKLPSSNMEKYMNKNNLNKLKENDVLKFVTNEQDLSRIEEVLREYQLQCYIYISPIFGQIQPNKIVDFMKQMNNRGINTNKVRVQVQLHKVIWNPNERGV